MIMPSPAPLPSPSPTHTDNLISPLPRLLLTPAELKAAQPLSRLTEEQDYLSYEKILGFETGVLSASLSLFAALPSGQESLGFGSSSVGALFLSPLSSSSSFLTFCPSLPPSSLPPSPPSSLFPSPSSSSSPSLPPPFDPGLGLRSGQRLPVISGGRWLKGRLLILRETSWRLEVSIRFFFYSRFVGRSASVCLTARKILTGKLINNYILYFF